MSPLPNSHTTDTRETLDVDRERTYNTFELLMQRVDRGEITESEAFAEYQRQQASGNVSGVLGAVATKGL